MVLVPIVALQGFEYQYGDLELDSIFCGEHDGNMFTMTQVNNQTGFVPVKAFPGYMASFLSVMSCNNQTQRS